MISPIQPTATINVDATSKPSSPNTRASSQPSATLTAGMWQGTPSYARSGSPQNTGGGLLDDLNKKLDPARNPDGVGSPGPWD
jgi:hypothetical protein